MQTSIRVAPGEPPVASAGGARRYRAEGVRRFLFGHDVFISYARADAVEYAQGLADALVQHGLAAYVDQLGTPPGPTMPPLLLLRLRLSSMLVLVASPGAAASQAVRQEVEEFSRRNHRIFVVDVAGALDGQEWYRGRIKGGPARRITPAELAAATPSQAVVEQIRKNVDFARREDRLRGTMRKTLAALAGLLLIAGAASLFAVRKADEAQTESERAGEAQESAKRANAQVDSAQRRVSELDKKAAAASDSARNALGLRDRARAEALQAQALARDALDSANARRRFGRALTLANQAEATLDETGDGLEHAARLAVESLEVEWTVEGYRAWLRTMALLPERLYTLRTGPVSALAVSADGRLLLTGDMRGTVRFWSVTQQDDSFGVTSVAAAPAGPELHTPGRAIEGLTLSPDGRWLAVLMYDSASVWDLRSRRPVPLLLLRGLLMGVAFSPDSRRLAVGTVSDSAVRLFETGTWRHDKLPVRSVRAMAFTPDGRKLVTVGDALEVWDLASRRRLAREEVRAREVAVSPGGDELMTRGTELVELIKLWSLQAPGDTGVMLSRAPHQDMSFGVPSIDESPYERNTVSFSPGGGYFAGGSGMDQTVRVWSIHRSWDDHSTGEVTRVARASGPAAFGPRGEWIAAAHRDSTVSFWRALPRGDVAGFRHPQGVSALSFSPNGRWLVSGDSTGTVRVFDVATLRPAVLVRHGAGIEEFAFSPGGRWLVAQGGADVSVFDAATWRMVASLPHAAEVSNMAFSPDGARLALWTWVGCGRLKLKEVQVWELPQGAQLGWERSGCDDDRDRRAPRRTGSAALLSRASAWPRYASLRERSPNGTLTARYWRGTIAVRDTAGRELPWLTRAGTGPVTAAEFSPDRRWIAVAHMNGELRLWPLGSTELISMACARLPAAPLPRQSIGQARPPADPCARVRASPLVPAHR